MICHPNAKINLGLNVTERRPDGYHNLETVFYPIPLCDTLQFSTDAGTDSHRPEGIFPNGIPVTTPRKIIHSGRAASTSTARRNRTCSSRACA